MRTILVVLAAGVVLAALLYLHPDPYPKKMVPIPPARICNTLGQPSPTSDPNAVRNLARRLTAERDARLAAERERQAAVSAKRAREQAQEEEINSLGREFGLAVQPLLTRGAVRIEKPGEMRFSESVWDGLTLAAKRGWVQGFAYWSSSQGGDSLTRDGLLFSAKIRSDRNDTVLGEMSLGGPRIHR